MKHYIESFWGGVIKGLVVIIPSAVTLFVILKVFAFTDNFLLGLLRSVFPNAPLNWPFGVGLLLTLLILWVIGVIAGRGVGIVGLSLMNSTLAKIPYLNKLFLALQQITNTFSSKQRRVFERAVLVPYPTHDSYSVGFVNGDAGATLTQALNGEKILAVFVPTTPNPSSGFLLYIEESKVKELNVSVEIAIKMVIAAGTVTAEELVQEPQTQTTGSKSSKDLIASGKWLKILQTLSDSFRYPTKRR